MSSKPLQWRHNGRDSVSNHQPHDCLLNRLFRRRSKKTSKLRVTDLYAGNSPGPVNSPHKWPVTRKMFPFDDVIMSRSAFVNRANKWYLIFISLYNEIHISLDNIKNQCTSQYLTSKKTSKLRVTGLCAGIHRGPVNSPHKRPVTRKMFPFYDVIMDCLIVCDGCWNLQWVHIR